MDFNEIAARIIQGGIANIIMVGLWLFVILPFSLFLLGRAIRHANRDNQRNLELVKQKEVEIEADTSIKTVTDGQVQNLEMSEIK